MREQRELREKEDAKELERILKQEDISWEDKKRAERELRNKKRRRGTDTGTLEGADDQPEDGGKRKKLKFSRIDITVHQ